MLKINAVRTLLVHEYEFLMPGNDEPIYARRSASTGNYGIWYVESDHGFVRASDYMSDLFNEAVETSMQ